MLSVDKFGRYNRKTTEKERKPFPTTTSGDYDVQDRLLRNVKEPVFEGDAATKGFVLKEILDKDKEGHYNFNNKCIKNLGEPVESSDGATKHFVEKLVVKRAHPDGDIDIEGKRIINVADPLLPTDAATYSFVKKNMIDQYDDWWSFKGKRLSNIQDPLYDGEAVTLRFLEERTVFKKRKMDKKYDAKMLTITNLGDAVDISDAVNMKLLKDEVKNWTKRNKAHMERLGVALFNYIHNTSSRSAAEGVNSKNFLNWQEIHDSSELDVTKDNTGDDDDDDYLRNKRV